jgi:hypothetical protein
MCDAGVEKVESDWLVLHLSQSQYGLDGTWNVETYKLVFLQLVVMVAVGSILALILVLVHSWCMTLFWLFQPSFKPT